ncbi:DUF2953 domain-containing protein [Pseudalkalibacillus decolorationis]|uniref:DUF2953 domain-containing protein n=1 Tax=Pseudalkalibacillus decolorationis TaxID=163879 RepID=UPI00214948C4|nr:DUF2953 domain-containing protein [Pseudalkalibacillus decolorationis]
MYWVIGIGIVVVILLTIILMSKVRISVIYGHQLGRDNLLIKAQFLKGLIHYSWQLPLDETDVAGDNAQLHVQTKSEFGNKKKESQKDFTVEADTLIHRIEKVKEYVDSVYQLGRIVRRFFKRITFEKLLWESQIGTGDAASTGIFSGLLWSIKGSIAGFLSFTATMKVPPIIEVTPSFQINVVNTRFVCIFSFRLGQAMFAAFQVAKNWKGREHHVRTSNPGFDANSDGKY